MNHQDIETLFWEEIAKKRPYGKALYKVITGVTKDIVYNWEKKRGAAPNIGEMLSVLYQLEKISVTQREEK